MATARMTLLASCLALTGTGTVPALAQEQGDELDEGAALLQQGLDLLLQGLMDELGPALLALQDQIGDLSAYYPPEILPNGDIIIRRKEPLDSLPEDESKTDL